MESIAKLARGLTLHFPDGNTPYQMATRLAEECGEVASAVCHLEGSGVKRAKHGPPDPRHLADEIKNVLSVAMQLAQYYGVEDALQASIDASNAQLQKNHPGL